jgi:hypothetical protein
MRFFSHIEPLYDKHNIILKRQPKSLENRYKKVNEASLAEIEEGCWWELSRDNERNGNSQTSF